MNPPANALCFGPDLPTTGVPCRVEISATILMISFDGLAPETVPLTALSVNAGGFERDQLVLTWRREEAERVLFVKDPTLITAFRQVAPPELLVSLERAAATVRRTRFSRRTILALVSGSLIGLLLALWLSFDAVVEFAVQRVPVSWEQQLGESARREILSGQTIIADGPAWQATQQIARRLTEQVPHSPYQFSVTLVKSETVNAFALPGGTIVVFTGLMKQAESPEEVAGVLGHELNHVLLRHGVQRLVKQLGLVAVAAILLGNQEGLVGLAQRLGLELITLKFGREQEIEADLGGLHLLYRARISPDGMIRFFERLSEADVKQIELLSTHPMSAARAERLKAELASLPPQQPVPFAMDWAAVRAALSNP